VTAADEAQSSELLASAEHASAQGRFREAVTLADRAAAVAGGEGLEELHIQVGALIVKRDALVELADFRDALDVADEIVTLCRPFPQLHPNAIYSAVHAVYIADRTGDPRLTFTEAGKLVALADEPLSLSDIRAACSLLLDAVAYLPSRGGFMRGRNARGTAERATTVARRLCTLATGLAAGLPEPERREVLLEARVALVQQRTRNLNLKGAVDPDEQLASLSTEDYQAAERYLSRGDTNPDRRDTMTLVVAFERQRRGDPLGAQRLLDERDTGGAARSAVTRAIAWAAKKLS
jgi:hypothetical protein